MEQLSLQSVIKFLVENKYLLISKGKYSLSRSFHEDVDKLRSLRDNMSSLPAKHEYPINDSFPATATDTMFFDLVRLAKVPARLDDGKGGQYDVNKYSNEAARALYKIVISTLYNWDILVKSTMLYYASGISYKKKIGNYILDGDWKSYYNDLELSVNSGEDALKDHIKTELDNGSHNQWSI